MGGAAADDDDDANLGKEATTAEANDGDPNIGEGPAAADDDKDTNLGEGADDDDNEDTNVGEEAAACTDDLGATKEDENSNVG